MKLRNRINSKLNIVSDKNDISSVKFKTETLESLLNSKNIQIEHYADMVEFKSSTEKGSIKFYAYKDEGYSVNVDYAFAKIFDFENDVTLSDFQIERLQMFVEDYVKNNPHPCDEMQNPSDEIINPYREYDVHPSIFY